MRLGEILIGQGLATASEIDAALQRQQRDGGRLGATLVAMGIMSVEQLLTVLRNQRESGAALAICRQTLDRWETIYGPFHPNTARAHFNLARTLLIAGSSAEAAIHAERARAALSRTVGANHMLTREAAQLLAEAQRAASYAAPAATAEPVA